MKIWTNKGTRGCSNPTKTSTTPPSISDLPSYILSKDGVKVNLTGPISGKWWPLHQNFYSSSEDLDKQRNQRLQQPNQDQQHSPKYIGSAFIHTSQAWCDLYMLCSQWAETSGHYIVIYTVLVKIWSNTQIIEPEASATQRRPAEISQAHRIFLHTYFQRME